MYPFVITDLELASEVIGTCQATCAYITGGFDWSAFNNSEYKND